jgi:ElaB/YqjD/DUF883 family membrane-anchored ribosome-binding protein
MATSADKEMAESLDRIRADIAALSDTVKTLVSDTAGIQSTLKTKLNDTARHAASIGEKAIHEATDMGSEAFHAAAKHATEAVENIEVKITRNPMTSVMIALGLGFAIGLLHRR